MRFQLRFHGITLILSCAFFLFFSNLKGQDANLVDSFRITQDNGNSRTIEIQADTFAPDTHERIYLYYFLRSEFAAAAATSTRGYNAYTFQIRAHEAEILAILQAAQEHILATRERFPDIEERKEHYKQTAKY
jgi:hypothetical protein